MKKWEIVVCVLLCISVPWALMHFLYLAPTAAWEERLTATKGLSRLQVIEKLGQPNVIVAPGTDMGEHSEVYKPVPAWPIKKEVLVYDHLNQLGFLFVDEKDVVEHVAFAGT